MLPTLHRLLLIVFLSIWHFNSVAQYDSTSSITVSEYRGDTLYRQDLTLQNFYDNKLVFEYKRFALRREEIDFTMTTNFYDLDGRLYKTTLIEHDEYECEPEYISNDYYNPIFSVTPTEYTLNFEYTVDSNNQVIPTITPVILPDSNNYIAKYCGRHYEKTTHYLPYIHVINSFSYYDEEDTTYGVDSLFFNRYGDKIRQVKYGNDNLFLEYRYNYVYDEQGRVLEKVWENLTLGAEFKTTQKFIYDGERQLSIYHSYHHFNTQEKATNTKTYYDENFETAKHERFYGDSLVQTYYYEHNDQFHSDIKVTAEGDTTNIREYTSKLKKNSKDSWTYQSKDSDKYHYTSIDTTYKKGIYTIEVIRYRITEEQYVNRETKMNSKNYIRYRTVKKLDKSMRLISEIDYTVYRGPFELRYDYR